MGCDIHFYVEFFDGTAWRVQPPPKRDLTRYPIAPGDRFANAWWGPDGCMHTYSEGCDGTYDVGNRCLGEKCLACAGTGVPTLHWYSNRHYILFGVLADVRRHDVPTIAEPRDEPADRDQRYRPSWDHTPSWLTLTEVLTFDWSQEITTYKEERATLADACDDFLAFINEIVWPAVRKFMKEIDQTYAQDAAVFADAEEERAGGPETEAYRELQRTVRDHESHHADMVRFVFGFDN